MYKRLDASELSTAQFFSYLTQVVVPRPVALVSSCDAEGRVNLSPFSFFNAFSARPPVLVFSPSRSLRDNSTKHTLDNVMSCPEAVVHIVSYAMVQQTSLSSTSYAQGVNEFLKAGFKEQRSEQVRPPRVAEAPVAFECRVLEIMPLGTEGGAGHLVICEILLMHIRNDIFNKDTIDPLLLDPIARLGGDLYARLNKEALFSVAKPIEKIGIGIDALPEQIRSSSVLTGNDLGALGNVEQLPSSEEVDAFAATTKGRALQQQLLNQDTQRALKILHQEAKNYLSKGDVDTAWRILLLR